MILTFLHLSVPRLLAIVLIEESKTNLTFVIQKHSIYVIEDDEWVFRIGAHAVLLYTQPLYKFPSKGKNSTFKLLIR